LGFCFSDQRFLVIHLYVHFSSVILDTKLFIDAVSTTTNG